MKTAERGERETGVPPPAVTSVKRVRGSLHVGRASLGPRRANRETPKTARNLVVRCGFMKSLMRCLRPVRQSNKLAQPRRRVSGELDWNALLGCIATLRLHKPRKYLNNV